MTTYIPPHKRGRVFSEKTDTTSEQKVKPSTVSTVTTDSSQQVEKPSNQVASEPQNVTLTSQSVNSAPTAPKVTQELKVEEKADDRSKKVGFLITGTYEKFRTFVQSLVLKLVTEQHVWGVVLYPFQTRSASPVYFKFFKTEEGERKCVEVRKSKNMPYRLNRHSTNNMLSAVLDSVSGSDSTNKEVMYVLCVGYSYTNRSDHLSDFQLGLTGSFKKDEEALQALAREAEEEIGLCGLGDTTSGLTACPLVKFGRDSRTLYPYHLKL